MHTAPTATPVPLVMSVNDAAAVLARGRTSIYRMIGRGELKPVRIGPRLAIPVDQITALVTAA